ncbi:hypothetical protein LSH36_948g00021 [Paralvinella palmiformis]|uniref:Uncharacterized protein n=1 Tax=Paralvinella palmiformis TaxID=53620 RepID=A0AAD9MSH1_9ANNE|nr:hypothetical protein LSH36_948g00021 [Paralvinella palmiformis]
MYGCLGHEMAFLQTCHLKTPEYVHMENIFNNTMLECIDDWTIVMHSHGDVKAWNVSNTLYKVIIDY